MRIRQFQEYSKTIELSLFQNTLVWKIKNLSLYTKQFSGIVSAPQSKCLKLLADRGVLTAQRIH